MKRPINVTAGIIISGRRVLIAKRPFGGFLGGTWEFPGGKIEPGETPAECLARELREELGVVAEKISYFDSSFYEYGKRRILLIGMLVRNILGAPEAREHEEIAWVPISDLLTWHLAPADVPLARRLQR